MQVIASQTAQRHLRSLVELLHHLKIMIEPEIIGVLQGLKPAGNLINSLESIIKRQLGDYTLQLPGISQGMVRAGRKEIEYHNIQKPLHDGRGRI